MNKKAELPPSDVPSRTPRNIRRRAGHNLGCGIWFLRLFILPHTLVGLGLIGWVVLNVALLAAGTNTQAEVVRKYRSSGDNGYVYNVEYAFGPDGRYRDKTSIPKPQYDRIILPAADQVERDTVAPSQLPVRYLAAGDLHYSHPLQGSWGLWGLLGFSILFGLFWNGILSVFFYLAWIGPYVGRKLYIHGKVARGRITSKKTSTSRPNRRGRGGLTKHINLKYEFETESGQTVKGSTSAAQGSPGDLDAYVGQAVTVLYRPDRPRQSVLYEYGNYEIEGS